MIKIFLKGLIFVAVLNISLTVSNFIGLRMDFIEFSLLQTIEKHFITFLHLFQRK